MIRHPLAILILLTGLNLLNYLDRYVLSAVLPRIEADLGLSKLVEGTAATVFLVGYFATSPMFGVLGDRGRRTRLIALGVAVWSLATLWSGLAAGKWSLLASRALVGIGEASYATIAPTVIDDLAPPERRTRWLAVFYAAMPIGSALGFFTGGLVQAQHGWRAAFYVAGGPGLVLALLCLLIVEPPRRAATTRESLLAAAKLLWPLRIYRRTVLGYAAYTFAIGGFAFWAPTFIYETYRLDLKSANLYFGGITVIAGAIGTVLGGFLGDAAAKKDRGESDPEHNRSLGYLATCALASAIGAPLAALCFVADTSGSFFAFSVPCQVALFVASSPINAAILRSVPEERRASAMALSIFVIHLFGDLWSPPLIGALSAYIPMRAAMFAVPVGFAIGAIIWFVPKSSKSTQPERART
ncbi:spinster family MFS transporter [Pendulispora albinea]|uniref:MFS transporter n=1 Tax=Pendulispora albinea TaxID=2741071 RepID=A0ABZ2M9A6_9BACT